MGLLLLPVMLRAAETSPQQQKRLRQQNLHHLWQQAAKYPSLQPAQAKQKALSRRKKMQRQATLALLQRGIIPGASGLGWAPLPLDELLRENDSPALLTTLQKVVDTLVAQNGLPYRWGGQTPNQGFDCSGLVWFAFHQYVNWPIPRTAQGLFNDHRMPTVFTSRLKRGDLLFFKIHRRDAPDHVGVYLGNQQFIEAPRTGLSIRISRLDQPFWQQHYAGARRVLLEANLRQERQPD